MEMPPMEGGDAAVAWEGEAAFDANGMPMEGGAAAWEGDAAMSGGDMMDMMEGALKDMVDEEMMKGGDMEGEMRAKANELY
jgi:hypothetical protein